MKALIWFLYGLCVWEGWLIYLDEAHRPRHALLALFTLAAIFVVTLKEEERR